MQSNEITHRDVGRHPSASLLLLVGQCLLGGTLGCGGASFEGFADGIDAGPTTPRSDAGSDVREAATPARGDGSSADGADGCSKREICNGVDDDCDGTADEGCPIGISWTFSADQVVLGASAGGSSFADACPAGQVLTGMQVAAGAWIKQIRGVCRSYELGVDTTAEPYRYRLATFGLPTMLEPHPAMVDETLQSLVCPDDHVLVGLSVSQDTWGQYVVIPKIWAQCAVLTVVPGETEGSLAIRREDPVAVGPIAGFYAGDAGQTFQSDMLDESEVPVQLVGAYGNWLDRIGYGVANLSVATAGVAGGRN